MTADLAAALLNRAANGIQLLQVLDSIADSMEQENAAPQPTAEPIQF
jgi:hypothetical protein